MTEKLTSIIIPVYNQLQYTRLCLLSIEKFTDPKYELIIVNNHSTDGTIKYLQEWQGI